MNMKYIKADNTLVLKKKPVCKSGQQITVDITGEVSTFQMKRKAIPFVRLDQIQILVNCTFFVVQALT